MVCHPFSCLSLPCSPSQGSSIVSNTDQGPPKPGVALLSTELSELTEGRGSQHFTISDIKHKHCSGYNADGLSLQFSQYDSLPGSVLESFSIVLHPISSYCRDKSASFIPCAPPPRICQQHCDSKHLFFGLCCLWRLVLKQNHLLKGSHKLEEERSVL